ncbi:hypothetical protein Tco_0150410 [Tanacetum coccineum]
MAHHNLRRISTSEEKNQDHDDRVRTNGRVDTSPIGTSSGNIDIFTINTIEVIDTPFGVWIVVTGNITEVTGSLINNNESLKVTKDELTSTSHDTLIVQATSVNAKPVSYAGAAGEPRKVSLPKGLRFSKKIIRVEYEWKPPRCEQCKIFGHIYDQCPNNAMATYTVDMTNDGFQPMVNKRKSGKTGFNNNHYNRSGVNGGKAVGQPIKPKFKYEPKAPVNMPKTGAHNSSTIYKAGPNNAHTS